MARSKRPFLSQRSAPHLRDSKRLSDKSTHTEADDNLLEPFMTYRSQLVLLDHDPHYAALTQIAVWLAQHLDCHLVGLEPTGVLDLQLLAEAGPSLTQLADLGTDTLR